MSKYFIARMIGNDLPPRHAENQSETNLKFILENELIPKGATRFWFLNRIVDRQKESHIIEIIRSAGEPFYRQAFDPDEFRIRKEKPFVKSICEVIQINAARNKIIEIGLAQNAEWILPLDGNCIFNSIGWEILTENLKSHNKVPFFINYDGYKIRPRHLKNFFFRNHRILLIPMYRLVDNNHFSNTLSSPAQLFSEHEPQIAFHRSSKIRFDPTLCYGNEDKVELLRRAGFPLQYTGEAMISEFKQARAGFVFRLASGVKEAEDSIAVRAQLRNEAAEKLLKYVNQNLLSGL